MLNCIGFLHATRKDFNFDVEFVIHGATRKAFNFDVNDGGGCSVVVWRKRTAFSSLSFKTCSQKNQDL